MSGVQRPQHPRGLARHPLWRDVLLVALTVSAGAVDTISFVALGEVFTANMTGNVVLLGIAVGRGASGLGPGVALAGYALGVLATALALGRDRVRSRWTVRVTAVIAAETVLQAGFLAGWLRSGGEPSGALLFVLIALSGVAMGLQSAGVRALAASGITTTYITGTITALLTELATLSGSRIGWARRAAVVSALAVGAGVMLVLLRTARLVAPALPLALTTLVVVTASLLVFLRREDS